MAASVGIADPEALTGLADADLHPPELAVRYGEDEERIMAGGEPVLIEQPVRRPDGGDGWFCSLKVPLKDEAGRVVGLVGHGRDITAQKAAETAVRAAEAEAERARAMLSGAAEVLADGFAIFGSDGRLALCNAAFAQAHGKAPARLLGRSFAELAGAPAFLTSLGMDDAAYAEWLAWRLAKRRAADGVPFELRLGARWYLIREQRTCDGSVLLVRTDVTHLKHVEEELRRLATTDPLTGVANRRHFVEQGSASSPGLGTTASRARWRCSTSTISSGSTTREATPPETRCCAK
jgi:PAS domain-containing protein